MTFRRRNPMLVRAKPEWIGDKYFPSKAQATRWRTLLLLERAGEIKDLVHEPKVVLLEGDPKAGLPTIAWHPDAAYIEKGRIVYEDTKPRDLMPHELLLLDLWRHFGPGLLRIIGKNNTVKTYMPKERTCPAAAK